MSDIGSEVGRWWNSVKDKGIWSGGLIGMDWDCIGSVWPGAQEEITEFYKSIYGVKNEKPDRSG